MKASEKIKCFIQKVSSISFISPAPNESSNFASLSVQTLPESRIQLPRDPKLVAKERHPNSPTQLPKSTSNRSEVRYFLYSVLTTRAFGLYKICPQWVLETCWCWTGDGIDLLRKDDDELMRMCPLTPGAAGINPLQHKVEQFPSPEAREMIGKALVTTINGLRRTLAVQKKQMLHEWDTERRRKLGSEKSVVSLPAQYPEAERLSPHQSSLFRPRNGARHSSFSAAGTLNGKDYVDDFDDATLISGHRIDLCEATRGTTSCQWNIEHTAEAMSTRHAQDAVQDFGHPSDPICACDTSTSCSSNTSFRRTDSLSSRRTGSTVKTPPPASGSFSIETRSPTLAQEELSPHPPSGSSTTSRSEPKTHAQYEDFDFDFDEVVTGNRPGELSGRTKPRYRSLSQQPMSFPGDTPQPHSGCAFDRTRRHSTSNADVQPTLANRTRKQNRRATVVDQDLGGRPSASQISLSQSCMPATGHSRSRVRRSVRRNDIDTLPSQVYRNDAHIDTSQRSNPSNTLPCTTDFYYEPANSSSLSGYCSIANLAPLALSPYRHLPESLAGGKMWHSRPPSRIAFAPDVIHQPVCSISTDSTTRYQPGRTLPTVANQTTAASYNRNLSPEAQGRSSIASSWKSPSRSVNNSRIDQHALLQAKHIVYKADRKAMSYSITQSTGNVHNRGIMAEQTKRQSCAQNSFRGQTVRRRTMGMRTIRGAGPKTLIEAIEEKEYLDRRPEGGYICPGRS